ncbi:MAG: MoxR family ATPase [Polyangiaceae bacterium]|nr:MoxR family ATPase [Polyangiaceae bacterium]
MDSDELRSLCERLKHQIGRVVVGQEAVVEALLIALLAGGHILLEGVPGTAKTLLAQTFASSLDLGMKRIQFTPDLMPGDVIGTNLFNFHTNQFTLTRGPIFTDFLLADEINRTPPKTQAALLQAMQERTVTIDGASYPLSDAFLVVATQNPIEQEGTYPLPEAQLDRFLLKILVGYPSRAEELAIVRRHGSRTLMPDVASFGLERVADLSAVGRARAAIAALHLSDEMIDYVVDLVRATRQNPAIQHGASPRAANMLATAARALAALRGRNFVIPDDVKEIFLPAMRHRIVLGAGAEVEGVTTDAVLKQILSAVAAPR